MTWNVEMTPKKPMSKKDGDLWPLEVPTVLFFPVWKGTLVSATMSPPEGVTAVQLRKASEKISHAYRCFHLFGGPVQNQKHHVERRWEVLLRIWSKNCCTWHHDSAFALPMTAIGRLIGFPHARQSNSKSVSENVNGDFKKDFRLLKKEGSLNFSNYLQGLYLQDIFVGWSGY